MTGLRSRLQHRFNPLHVYCRLRCLGFSGPLARSVCAVYERLLYRRTLS
ncbi:MAG: hypothetical protein H0S85_04275 [Desulfovibrionaceae bacterium]|jgi:hypothetical protein|nr:hypothetical protein [Desulfovibrionaceae bacterium]